MRFRTSFQCRYDDNSQPNRESEHQGGFRDHKADVEVLHRTLPLRKLTVRRGVWIVAGRALNHVTRPIERVIMPNIIRGEAELAVAGKTYRLLLTLGALAEIEDGLNLPDLAQLGARLKHARAADLAIVAAALLRGGGHEIAPAEVLRLPCDLGALVAAVGQAFERAGSIGPFAGATSSPSG